MTFREDMYSLLFMHLVKPQYKKYCDLVARTGQKLPHDYKTYKCDKEEEKEEKEEQKLIDKPALYCKKFRSFCCCKRAKIDEYGHTDWAGADTLVLDVIKLPINPTPGAHKPLGETDRSKSELAKVDLTGDLSMVDGPAFDNQQLRRRTTVTKTADIHKFIQVREEDEDDGYFDDNTVIQRLDVPDPVDKNEQDKDEDNLSIISARPTGWSVKDLIETPK